MSALLTLRSFQLFLAALVLAAAGCFSLAQADDALARPYLRTKQWLNPFAPRLLNPQPLPPKSIFTSPAGDKMLNPQPLPPKVFLLRKQIR